MPLPRQGHRAADRPLSCCLAFVFVLLLPVVFAAAGRAQSPCGVLLDAAEKRYEAGDFKQVPELLVVCTKGKTSRGERSDALALIAKAYVMSDRIRQARLTIEELLRVEKEYEPDTRRDPLRFIRLVEEVQRETATVKVASVSKSDEPLREAPATVVVVTGEEIERRGYLHLEALLHDLPGFDIARSNGLFYSNIYQRGLRAPLTARTLLLLDGTEENELWTQVPIISRQYPLSNVERVEVIYGPAATMYGANAFAGVVNVISKEPESFIGTGKSWGTKMVTNIGPFNTKYFEATIAGRTTKGNLSWSLTGRIFESDEPDLSQFEDWNFDPADFASEKAVNRYQQYLSFNPVDNGGLSVVDFIEQTCTETVGDEQVLDPNCVNAINNSPYLAVTADGISLTEAGLQKAIELDQAAYSEMFEGKPTAYSDRAEERYVSGKLKISGLLLGFRLWDSEEGAGGWYTDLYVPGSENGGSTWEVECSTFYAKYSSSIGSKSSLNFSAYYRTSAIGDNTTLAVPSNYVTGENRIKELVFDTPATWRRLYVFLASNQLRAEMNMNVDISENIEMVAGIELRDSMIQRTYVMSIDQRNPEEIGFVGGFFLGDNHFRVRDLGAYVQASYRPLEKIKVIAGGRIDKNQVRQSFGYGTAFNPRLALIFSPGDFVFKTIYSTAFQDATYIQKYQTLETISPNPDLEPERIKNFELSASWQPRESLGIELAAYTANISNMVDVREIACDECTGGATLRFQAAGAAKIQGAQVTTSWQFGKHTLTGNYTYTHPFLVDPRDARGNTLYDPQGNPVDRLRVGDMAKHQVRLQFNSVLWRDLDFSILGHYVGRRKTVPTNPFDEIDSYAVLNAAVTYKDVLPGISFQVVAENLLDKEYFHPGVNEADGIVFAARIPQPKRSVYAKMRIVF